MKPRPGPDGLHIEAFQHGRHRLKFYLSILFNLLLLHGCVPDAFYQSVIIPSVRYKAGDSSYVNNYRAITLSNSITKISELLLLSLIDSYDTPDEYQFGFKSNHPTATCSHAFTNIASH